MPVTNDRHLAGGPMVTIVEDDAHRLRTSCSFFELLAKRVASAGLIVSAAELLRHQSRDQWGGMSSAEPLVRREGLVPSAFAL